MNSRDRLRAGDLRAEIEEALEDLLKHHQGLRELRERRRREDVDSRLDDSKPLEDILESLLKSSPTLSELFLVGRRLSNPFKTTKVKSEEKEFQGKDHPTFFKFKDREYGTVLQRSCHENMRCRITFETDVVNDYFSRNEMPGTFTLTYSANDQERAASTYGINLQNGIATLSVVLPADAEQGHEIYFTSTVADDLLLEPFVNVFNVKVVEPATPTGKKGNRRKPPTAAKGMERELPIGIELPKVTRVYEGDWNRYGFDKYSALKIKDAGEVTEGNAAESSTAGRAVYDFFVNMDNIYLRTELKGGDKDLEIVRARFTYGLVLIGLALLHYEAHASEDVYEEEDTAPNGKNVEDKAYEVSKALAPVLIPMIDSLGALTLDELAVADASGEAT